MKRRRQGTSAARGTTLVLGCAATVVFLLSNCRAANSQQQQTAQQEEHTLGTNNERGEPAAGAAVGVDVDDEDIVSVPEMAPVEDVLRRMRTGDTKNWDDWITPSSWKEEEDEKGEKEDDSTPLDAAAMTGFTSFGTETQPPEIQEHVVASEMGGDVDDQLEAAATTSAGVAGGFNGNAAADVVGSNSRQGPTAKETLVATDDDGVHVAVEHVSRITAVGASGAATEKENGDGEEDGHEEEEEWEKGGREEGEMDQPDEKDKVLEESEETRLPLTDVNVEDRMLDAGDGVERNDEDGQDSNGVGSDVEFTASSADGGDADDGAVAGVVGGAVGGDTADVAAAATAATTEDQRRSSGADKAAHDDKAPVTQQIDGATLSAEESSAQDDPEAGKAGKRRGSTSDGPVVGISNTGDAGAGRSPSTTAGFPPTDASDSERPLRRPGGPGEESRRGIGDGDSRVDGVSDTFGLGTGLDVQRPDGTASLAGNGSRGRRDGEGHAARSGGGLAVDKSKVRVTSEGVGGYGGSGGGGDEGGIGFARGSQEELAQRVRDMEAELLRKLLAEEDAKTLLDIWVERAREYVLTRTVPPTDAECDFSWSRLRCEPKCSCGARLRFGDYTPGRTCRLLHHWERSPDCEDAWDPSDEPAVRRLASTVVWALGSTRRAYEARVAPPSDPECRFNFETRRCEPQPLCRLRFRWGDLSLSSACRLAPEETPAEQKAAGGGRLY